MLEQIRDFLGFTAEELKEEVLLKRKDSVFYLVLNRKGNAFNADFLKGINAKLDIVEQC
jgi:enoyl-CoA hydratase/carnithine racemase